MLFYGPTSVQFTIEIDGIELPMVKVTKFLGVLIDDHLKWDHHISKLILKIKRNCQLLQTGKNLLSIYAKKLIYFTHIKSHITYSLSVWGNLVSTSQLAKLQAEQTRYLKLIHKNWSQTVLQILSIIDLVQLENAKFGYKVANGLLPSTIVQSTETDSTGKRVVKRHKYLTRNKNSLNRPRANTTKYLNSVFCQGPKIFAECSLDLQNSTSLSAFANKYKKKLLSKYSKNLMGLNM